MQCYRRNIKRLFLLYYLRDAINLKFNSFCNNFIESNFYVFFRGGGCHGVTLFRREIIVRGQSYLSRLPKYWPPIPLSARRVCPPPAIKAGGHTRRAERGMGGQYVFWKTREIGLPSYNDLSTLSAIPIALPQRLRTEGALLQYSREILDL